MPTIKILAFAGSARRESFNKKLIKVAAKCVEQAGAQVTLIDLKDYPMPLYNQDLEAEEGLPDNARKVKKLFIEHDGLLISAPEYNSSITPLLKNTIDWVSRKSSSDEASLLAYKGKVAALLSASAGNLGGLRGLVTLRSILGNIGVIVLPTQKSLSKADVAFNADGTLKDAKELKDVERVGQELVSMLTTLRGK